MSYTYDKKSPNQTPHRSLWDYLLAGIPDYMREHNFGEPKPAPSRRPYVIGLNYSNHTFIWCDGEGHFLVEHTGAGCDALDSVNLLETTIVTNASRLTRLDVATDILTKVRPEAFVARRSSAKERSGEEKWSPDGRTCYIGARQSNRFAKVYRYDGKHPRKDYLRIEYTYRREDAQKVGKLLKTVSIEEIAVVSGKRYKWKHPCYKPEFKPSIEQITAYRPERDKGKTVGWLYTQVTATLVRLSKDGIIDLQEYFDHVRKEAQKPT